MSFYDNTLGQVAAPFTITKAQYGSTSTSGSNVTTTVRNAYESGASSIGVNNGTFGDPQPGVAKRLWVEYTSKLGNQTLNYAEGSTFNFSDMGTMTNAIDTTATSTVAVMDITSRNKSVSLSRNATAGSIFVAIGYTTSTSTINKITVYQSPGLQQGGIGSCLGPISGPACAMIFVSTGSFWALVGTFAGTSTVYANATVSGLPEPSSVIVSLTSTEDTIALQGFGLNDGDSRIYFFKTTNIQYANGAVIYAATGDRVVNESYGYFYRSGNTPNSSYIALCTKLAGWSRSRVLPVAMYPSEY
jgi:hypothetical protein